MKFARLLDGMALDVVDADPIGLFHPGLAATFVEVPDGVLTGSRLVEGEWIPPDNHDEEQTEVYVPLRLALIDFLRLFTTTELAGFNALRKACQALAPGDYQAASEGDEAKAALVGFEVFLTFYDALRNGLIELNQTQTIQGLQLLVPLGVLSEARLQAVLANQAPA